MSSITQCLTSWPGLLRLALLALVILATGCGSGSGTRRADLSYAAQAAYLEGRYGEAAELFSRLAERSSSPASLLLREADARLLAGQVQAAGSLLAGIDRNTLTAKEQGLADLLDVLVEPERWSAQQLLRKLPSGLDVPRPYAADYHRTRARAFEDLSRPHEAAMEYMALQPMLIDERARRTNFERTLGALQRLSIAEARALRAAVAGDEVMVGWLDLVLILKEAMAAGGDPNRALNAWKTSHPRHPANELGLAGLEGRIDVGIERDRMIAVLLPETGPLAAAGAAVRSGIVAAYLNAPTRRGQLKFYDTGGNVPGAIAAWDVARSDGATHVIGPLDKDGAAAVLAQSDSSVVTLALNYVDQAGAGFQFGLLPEHDAEAVALEMINQGHLRAITMTPAGDFGDRLRAAFAERFTALGGVIFESATYPSAMRDFEPLIERVTGINQARVRHRQLQSALGLQLDFDAQPRPDVDGLFLGARPREGRLIKPQLAFHQAGHIPVFATSHIYSGTPDAGADGDLEGIGFCDLPWLLGAVEYDISAAQATDAFPEAAGSSLRLFALGVDALRLLPYLEWLSQYSADRYPGLSGSLGIDREGRLRRRLACGRFEDGVPTLHEAGSS